MGRPKSSLGSVKIEEFYGKRSRYLKWKKAVQARQRLYKLEEEELAMLDLSEHQEGCKGLLGSDGHLRIHQARWIAPGVEAA